MPPWLVKFIITRLFKAFKKKREWKRIDDYVNKENALDKQVKQLQKNQAKFGKTLESVEKNLANADSVIKELKKKLSSAESIIKKLKRLV